MKLQRKQLEIIGAILIIIVLIFVVVYMLQEKEAVETDVVETDQVVETQVHENFPEKIEISGEPEVVPTPVARAFVERFGSFSTQSDYTNIQDVMVLATPELQGQLDEIARSARSEISSSFYGVSTKVIGVETLKETVDSASISVATQRQETFDTPENTSIKYQDIELAMVRVGDDWLVSSFAWQ